MSLITADGYKCTKGSKFQTTRDGSCFQRALANATGLDFDVIYQKSLRTGIKKAGRGGSNVWKFDRENPTRSTAVACHKCTGLTGWKSMKHLYRKAGLTLNQFVKRFPVGTFVIVVRGHALAIVDGVVYDNKDRVSGRHRVWTVVEFTGTKEQAKEARDERRAKLDQQAEKLDANFKIYTGRSFCFENIETVELVKKLGKEDKRFSNVPVTIWALLDRHAFQLRQFGPLY
jgi:hypothetical protein